MVVCDLDGKVVEGDLAPSSDTAAHAFIYRNLGYVGGVTHTHSTYAVAWAARGEPVPCVLTAMADEFGGPIPVAPFALIGTDAIGRIVVDTLRNSLSPAVLIQNHGPFTVGATRPRRGEGGGHVRGRVSHACTSPVSWANQCRSPTPTYAACTTATRTSTASHE